jgi:hypothetical protein
VKLIMQRIDNFVDTIAESCPDCRARSTIRKYIFWYDIYKGTIVH